MLTCDGQNRILFKDVLDEINQNGTNIGIVATGVNSNSAEINSNNAELADHESRLSMIEGAGGSLPVLESRVGALEVTVTGLEADVASNTSDIIDSAIAINTLATDATALSAEVSDNATAIAQNTTDIGLKVNKADVLTPESPTNKILTEDDFLNELSAYTAFPPDPVTNIIVTQDLLEQALQEKRYSIIRHIEALGVPGGASTDSLWEIRTLNTAFDDNLGILLPSNKLSLEAGDYCVTGFAAATGAYHQCRLYDNTGGAELAIGSSGDGMSHLCASFTLGVDSEIVLQSQVDTSVPTDGYGKANPFGEGLFVSLQITKQGA